MNENEDKGEAIEVDAGEGRLIVLFHDLEGRPVEREDWHRLNEGERLQLARFERLGLRIDTEWIGVNHNGDPDGRPWIFETVVRVGGAHAFSTWASDRRGAMAAHALAVVRGCLYGFAWWHLRLALARTLLRRRLERGEP